MAKSIHSGEDSAGSRVFERMPQWSRAALFQASAVVIKIAVAEGVGGGGKPPLPTKRGRSVRLPPGGRQLGAAGRARSAHIMKFRPVGVESPGKERAEEGPDSGEGIGVSVTAFCRGGKGGRIDARQIAGYHDESCLFSRVF
jgi:hypothetical protein